MNGTTDFNKFLSQNAWWIALIFVGLIVVVLLLIFFFGRKKRKSKVPHHEVEVSEYYAALGGAENLISHVLQRSRIVIEVKDVNLIDQPKLKEAGVDGFIVMSNKVTLVIKGDAKEVYETLFGKSDA